MPNIGDILEPILADLDHVEEQAKAWIASNVLDDRPFVAAMARVCASLRPVLEQANEALADLEVALHQNARIEMLESALRDVFEGRGCKLTTPPCGACDRCVELRSVLEGREVSP